MYDDVHTFILHLSPDWKMRFNLPSRDAGALNKPLTVLTEDRIDRVHEPTLKILAETGVVFWEHEAVEVLSAAGASVDRTTGAAIRRGEGAQHPHDARAERIDEGVEKGLSGIIEETREVST